MGGDRGGGGLLCVGPAGEKESERAACLWKQIKDQDRKGPGLGKQENRCKETGPRHQPAHHSRC